MPKRKRDHGDVQINVPITNGKYQPRPIDAKLFHYKKLLQHALRVAKGFERQKLARRYKKAAESDEQANLKRFGIEISAIKSLDLSEAADTHLRRVVGKDKDLAASHALREYLHKPLQLPLHDASANVLARLCNSNAVKSCIQDIVRSLHEFLEKNKPKRKTEKERTAESEPKRTSQDVQVSFTSPRNAEGNTPVRDEEDQVQLNGDAARSSTSPSQGQNPGDELNDFEHLDDLVAESDASSAASNLAEQDEVIGGINAVRTNNKDISSGINARLRTVGPSEDHRKPYEIPPEPRRKGESTFMPSLTMGGYWSGGESDISDVDKDMKPRKNRRGQRERRLIWEKKYGKNANHLKNGQDQGQRQGLRKPESSKSTRFKRDGRDEGWDPKRGAQGFERPFRDKNGNGANAVPVNNRNARRKGLQVESKPESKPAMHPSWEAKQKAKAAETAKGRKFEGKKITFD